MNISRTIAKTVAGVIVAGATAATLAGTANAVTLDANDSVKYVFCSDQRTGNEITYYDNYGKQDGTYTLKQANGSHWCGSVSLRSSEGGYVWSSINQNDGGYVYCAIYVNGSLQERNVDMNEYYAAAMC